MLNSDDFRKMLQLENETIAFLVHMPEIEEYLKTQFEHSSIVRMIVKSISQELNKLRKGRKLLK
jgi:cell fate (sporulation/competence/biofilm development) regulator YmcA (YheA/YmcA/DUF963 family)